MSRPDPHLNRMVARLAGMPQSDRAYVLGRLGVEACHRLAPLLHEAGGTSDTLSPGLQALVQAVARGQRPPALTAKALAALQSIHRGEP